MSWIISTVLQYMKYNVTWLPNQCSNICKHETAACSRVILHLWGDGRTNMSSKIIRAETSPSSSSPSSSHLHHLTLIIITFIISPSSSSHPHHLTFIIIIITFIISHSLAYLHYLTLFIIIITFIILPSSSHLLHTQTLTHSFISLTAADNISSW